MLGAARLSLYNSNVTTPAGGRTGSAKTFYLGSQNSLDTVISKYGGGSLYVGPGYGGTPSNQYKHSYTEPSSDFVFGTSDFTIECWIRPAQVSTSDNRILIGVNDTIGTTDPSGFGGEDICWAFMMNNTTYSGGLPPSYGLYWFYPNGSGSIGYINFNAGSAVLPANEWRHVAMSKSGTTLRAFVSGNLIGTETGHNVNYIQTGSGTSEQYNNIRVWTGSPLSGEVQMGGNIDDIRIIKGTAVYTSSFTPPAAPLTNTSDTVLLAHLDNSMDDDTTS